MKVCFKCNVEKPLDGFYRHSGMRDGHLNKCKDCTKRDVRLYRRSSPAVREYDRNRAKLPHRRAQIAKASKRWKEANPEGYRAHYTLTNAVRDGKIERQPCEICGEEAHAHHPDYSKPLDVVWLCPTHHARLHAGSL